jgi:hypothetical protein
MLYFTIFLKQLVFSDLHYTISVEVLAMEVGYGKSARWDNGK